MARRPSTVVRFPGSHGIIITDDEHRLLSELVAPYYGAPVAACLDAATATPGGRRIDIDHPAIDDLLGAISCECHGYQKLDAERQARGDTPKPGSTADELLAIYDRLAGPLS